MRSTASRSLLAKSLVRDDRDRTGEPRYGMLESIRAFGLERLAASGEEEAGLAGRRAAWCLAFALHGGAKVKGPDDAIWLQRLERGARRICRGGPGLADGAG